jgi:hypothetical protein
VVAVVHAFDTAAGPVKPKFGQLPISYDADEDLARERARKLWRWGVGGWKVSAELPDPEAFDAYSATRATTAVGAPKRWPPRAGAISTPVRAC